MNCRDFRRRLLVDPAREDAEDARHAARCPACTAERARARAFEERLRTLLAEEVETHPVPPAGRSERPRRLRMIPLALAATAVLAFGLIVAARADSLTKTTPDDLSFQTNISAMSYGAISRPAVVALGAGAAQAGCWDWIASRRSAPCAPRSSCWPRTMARRSGVRRCASVGWPPPRSRPGCST
jgi:glutamate synthase domain-containing protein 2